VSVLASDPIEGFIQSELDDYPLQGNQVVLAALDYVVRTYNLRPTWSSMWGARTPEAGRRLGIGADWPALSFEWPDPDGPSTALLSNALDGVAELKAPQIVLLIGDEPVAWIDDDITPRLERWAARRDKTVPTLLVKPNPKVGLTLVHLEELIRFVHRVRDWRERNSSPTAPTTA